MDFLIRVGSAVASLLKDWPTQINRAEAEILQYVVSLNGVKEGVRHVLSSRAARDGLLMAEQMCDTVKQHETYVAHQKLGGWLCRSPNPRSDFQGRLYTPGLQVQVF